MKKIWVLLLAALTVIALLSASALADDALAFQKFDHVVEVHIGMSVSPTDTSLEEGDTYDNNYYTRYLLDNYNIKVVVDWTAAEGDNFNQKVAQCIASDSLPDGVVVTDRSYFLPAAENEMLYDLSDVFDKYASDQVKQYYDLTNGQALANVTYGGEMLALMNITAGADGVHVLMIQQNWLDELGLEAPKTLKDVYEIAKKFKEAKLAGDRTVPILGAQKDSRVYANFLYSSNIICGFEPVFTALDAYPGFFLVDDAGKVSYGTTSSQMRDSLELLAKWYAEGLIDPEFATRDSYAEVINANECGMFFAPWWEIGYGNLDSFRNSDSVDWQAYAIYTDDGKWNSKMKTVGTSYTLVNCDVSEEVAAAIVIMNNAIVRYESIFNQETVEGIGWYPLRNVMTTADECEHTYRELLKVLNGEADPEAYKDEIVYKTLYSDVSAVREVIPGYEKGRQISRKDFVSDITNKNYQRMYSLLIGDRPYATGTIDKPVYSVTYATNDVIDRYWTNLSALEDTVIRSIITGQSDISAFDDFVKQWMAEGGDKVLESVQAEYDAAH
jgi:multiple sugar transport system substrate-binding protein/putative aldouronate transport system substrate-binding protein